jgi:hypothetical protein
MDYHVITPFEEQLVMQTEGSQVVEVWPAPPSSLPADTRDAPESLKIQP